MFNSRDSYTDYNPNKKEMIEVPYMIGTIVELKDNSDVLAKICQYRITIKNSHKIIYVGLATKQYERDVELYYEITSEELLEKWKKTDKMLIGKIDRKKCIRIPGFDRYYCKKKEFYGNDESVKVLKRTNNKQRQMFVAFTFFVRKTNICDFLSFVNDFFKIFF